MDPLDPRLTHHPHPLAVVTGASSGIGLALARELADRGYDLVIAAEDDAIVTARAELEALGVEVVAVQTDLSTLAGVDELYRATAETGRPLDLVALNAGVGQGRAFLENDIRDEIAVIDLNVTSTVRLAHLYLREMVAIEQGRLLVTSPVAAELPGSFQSVYNASKSFVQSFAQALQSELEDSPVTIIVLMPGPTETEFFDRADMLDTTIGRSSKDDPDVVAAQAVEAALDGRARVVGGGLATKTQDVVSKVLPDRLKAAMHRRMSEPDS